MKVVSTRLRYISSKDELALISAVDRLPFKIEIKGNPVLKDGRWIPFFVIPDTVKEFDPIDLDDL